jgi:hypothetical protein
VGFFGDIRPYKNAEVLAYLPDQDAIGREIKMVVAGAADPTYNTTEIEALPQWYFAKANGDNKRADRRSSLGGCDSRCRFRVVTLSSRLEFRVQHAGPKLWPEPALLGAAHVQRAAESAWSPWVHIFDHDAKNLSAEIETALSRVQQDVVDPDPTSRLAASLDDCSFDHGAQQLRQLYQRLMN